mmetsp:Transcript_47898/g.147782  ORF Transcript_47898/g.147782 Transcript_47898/m.147782 type:complete len:233 (+) Transcript_47898:539-1237(+)
MRTSAAVARDTAVSRSSPAASESEVTPERLSTSEASARATAVPPSSTGEANPGRVEPDGGLKLSTTSGFVPGPRRPLLWRRCPWSGECSLTPRRSDRSTSAPAVSEPSIGEPAPAGGARVAALPRRVLSSSESGGRCCGERPSGACVPAGDGAISSLSESLSAAIGAPCVLGRTTDSCAWTTLTPKRSRSECSSSSLDDVSRRCCGVRSSALGAAVAVSEGADVASSIDGSP